MSLGNDVPPQGPSAIVDPAITDDLVETLFEKMKSGRARLDSFRVGNWPITFLRLEDLAEAGFFYLMIRDTVQCAFCRGIISDWNISDEPVFEHTRCFPKCPFVLEYNVGNRCIRYDPFQIPNHTRATELEKFGMETFSKPKTRDYLLYEKRLESFDGCVDRHLYNMIPEDLAAAGFFYFGTGDRVKCFSCNGGLDSWTPHDVPWNEHAYHYPNCQFVRLNRGTSFIASCLSERVSHEVAAEIELWFESDVVVRLREAGEFDKAIIYRVLRQQYKSCKKPFLKYSELHNAATELCRQERCQQTTIKAGSDVITSRMEAFVCKVCLDKDISVVLLPCKHFVTCSQCTALISQCPICQQNIRALVRPFM